jgi:uncharacterized protein YodC (DUF2158 family)
MALLQTAIAMVVDIKSGAIAMVVDIKSGAIAMVVDIKSGGPAGRVFLAAKSRA